MWTFFTLCMIGIGISIVLLIRKFAAKNVEVVVLLATAYAWLTAMMVIALVPIDVWAAYIMSSNTKPIAIMWNIAYWSTQAATWFVMPFYQVYSESGDFSVKNKCLTSLKENALLYGAVGALGAVGLIIILASTGLTSVDDLKQLLNIGIFASNTFGLVVGLLLMGYGLVEIPRSMWITSNPDIMLKWCAHRCGKHAEAVMRSTNELETVVTIICANDRQMRRGDALRPFMEIISTELEKGSPIKPTDAQRNVDIEGLSAEDLEYNYDKKGLAELRRRMKNAVADYQGDRVQYERAMLQSFELEDVIKCRSLREYTLRPQPGAKSWPWSQPMWTYKCVAKPYATKVYSVLLGVLGCCIVWSEVVIPVQVKDLSPFSHILRDTDTEFPFQFLTIMPLIYMCACSYYALFKINAFNYNKLIIGATTGAALMQNGSLMARFAAPTCWNFYHIIRFAKDYCPAEAQAAGQCQLTVFSVIMSSMADVSAFKYININMYLPVVLVVHCAMVALGIWDRLLNMCVSARFKFTTHDVDDEYTEKGRLLIRKEQEATLKGFKIGEVLHSAYFDLEFPTIANAGRRNKGNKGIFGGLFGKKKAPEVIKPLAPAHPPRPQSTAAAAASRWVRGGAAESSTTSLVDAGTAGGDNPTTSLLSAKYDQGGAGATLSTAPPASKGGSGLDGIFADLGSRFASSGAPSASVTASTAASSSSGAPAGTSRLGLGSAPTAPSTGGTKLVFGKKEDTPATKETDSLLGLWGRS